MNPGRGIVMAVVVALVAQPALGGGVTVHVTIGLGSRARWAPFPGRTGSCGVTYAGGSPAVPAPWQAVVAAPPVVWVASPPPWLGVAYPVHVVAPAPPPRGVWPSRPPCAVRRW